MNKFEISSRLLSQILWQKILFENDHIRTNLESLSKPLLELESLRTSAKYNTGTVSLFTALSLHALVSHFKPKCIAEVGTFIGRTTLAMKMATENTDAVIHTCDYSNDIALPFSDGVTVIQYPMTSSNDMFRRIGGKLDMIVLDGRLQEADLQLIEKLITPNTIICLDDCDGSEKGHANLFTLRATVPGLSNHLYVWPPNGGDSCWIPTGYNTLGSLLPLSLIGFASQG